MGKSGHHWESAISGRVRCQLLVKRARWNRWMPPFSKFLFSSAHRSETTAESQATRGLTSTVSHIGQERHTGCRLLILFVVPWAKARRSRLPQENFCQANVETCVHAKVKLECFSRQSTSIAVSQFIFLGRFRFDVRPTSLKIFLVAATISLRSFLSLTN